MSYDADAVWNAVEPCEPECSPDRHAVHQAQWNMAQRITGMDFPGETLPASPNDKPHLVTAFSQGPDGRRFVLVGLTDAILDEIKAKGGILQEAERNGQNTDVAILYAPGLNELVAKLKKATGKVEISFI